MKKQTRNKVNMIKTTGKFLKKNEEKLQDSPEIMEINGKVQENVEEIEELDSQLEEDTTGTTEEKDILEEQLAAAAFVISLILKAHARKLKDKALLNSVSFSKSQLYYVAEQTLLSRARHLLTQAKAHAEGAAAYGLTPEQITSLETLISSFNDNISNPRQMIIDKKDVGARLYILVRATDNLLKEDLDVLMDVKGIEDPDLLNKYRSAREIIDRN